MDDIARISLKVTEQGHQALTTEELIRLKDYYIQLIRSPGQPPIVKPLCRREMKKIDSALDQVG